MTKSRVARWGILAAVLVAAMGSLVIESNRAATPSIGAGPEVSEPVVLQEPVEFEGGFRWDPPASGKEPPIDGNMAIEIAREYKGSEWEGAKSVHTTLLALTDPHAEALPGVLAYDGRQVWVVTIDGVCVPWFGSPLQPVSGCASTVTNVVVDAATGEVVREYSG